MFISFLVYFHVFFTLHLISLISFLIRCHFMVYLSVCLHSLPVALTVHLSQLCGDAVLEKVLAECVHPLQSC